MSARVVASRFDDRRNSLGFPALRKRKHDLFPDFRARVLPEHAPEHLIPAAAARVAQPERSALAQGLRLGCRDESFQGPICCGVVMEGNGCHGRIRQAPALFSVSLGGRSKT